MQPLTNRLAIEAEGVTIDSAKRPSGLRPSWPQMQRHNSALAVSHLDSAKVVQYNRHN